MYDSHKIVNRIDQILHDVREGKMTRAEAEFERKMLREKIAMIGFEARAAIKPTTEKLQQSALELLERMLAVGGAQ